MTGYNRANLIVLRELDTPVPDITLDLVAQNPTYESANLVWSVPNMNGTTFEYYEIQQKKTSESVFQTIGTSTTNSYTATGLDSEESYDFRVKTVSTEWPSPFGNVADIETPPNVPLFQFKYAMIAVSQIDRVEVVALENTTITQNGTTVATLTAWQTQTIPASQFDVMIGTWAFVSHGMNGIHTYNLTPNYAVGKKFAYGAIRANPQTASVYAVQDSNVTVTAWWVVVWTQFIPADTWFDFVFNSTNQGIIIESDGLIMAAVASNNNFDQKSLLPASTTIVWFASSRAVIYWVENDTFGWVYRWNGTTFGWFGFHWTNESFQTGNTWSQYAGQSVTVKANRWICASSFANSNWVKSAPLLPTTMMYTNVWIALQQDWIAFANDGTPFTISTSNWNSYTSIGSTEAQYIRITAAADRVPWTLFTSTAPIWAWHQNQNEDPDESILLWWTL